MGISLNDLGAYTAGKEIGIALDIGHQIENTLSRKR